MNTVQKAQSFAKRINAIVGLEDSCRWCEFSRAWFVFLPLDMEEPAMRLSDLFVKAGCDHVSVEKSAEEYKIQISAYVH